MNDCPHLSKIGDNYGESCLSCGKQLLGYGYGGFFGRNITGKEECIHLFAPMGEGGASICIYCEEIKASDEPTDRDEKRANDAFTDWNAGERPAHWP